MSIHSDLPVQDAVYWPPATKDKFGEVGTWTPQDVRVRWVDTQEEIVLGDGDTFLSNAKVFTDFTPALGGMLTLGTVAGLTTPTDPTKEGAYPIRKTRNIPNYDGDETLKVVYL